MNDLIPSFKRRDLTTSVFWANNTRFMVDKMDWAANGGPINATIIAQGSLNDIWELLDFLRFGVTIYDSQADPVWWGYVAEVVVSAGSIQVGVTIDSMANNIAVVYSYVPLLSNVVGERRITAWASDSVSIAEFGQKDYLCSQGGMSDAAATAGRDVILAAKRYPQGVATINSAINGFSAVIYCRGWFDTLRWRMASVSTTNNVVTTTQINNLISTYGAFFAGTRIFTASGVSSSDYRNGDNNVQAEILEMLNTGTSTGTRLLATVSVDRYLDIDIEPANTSIEYYMDQNGKITKRHWASRVNKYYAPVGKWVRLVDVIPDNVDISKLITPTLQFVESATWDAKNGMNLVFRGQPSISDLLKVK